MLRRAPGAAAAMAFGAASIAAMIPLVAQDPQRPVFRAGVDLVTVDVVVLDKAGRMVTDLTMADFTVVAGNRPRRLVSAEFVAPAPARPRGVAPHVTAAPAPTTNRLPPAGRTFMVVIDVEGIRAGEGRGAMNSLAEFLDRLDPADRVGMVALPYGSPRVDLTTNRAVVKQAAAQVAGASSDVRESTMTYGEADSIRRGDTRALVSFWERRLGATRPSSGAGERCPGPGRRPIEEPLRVSDGCRQAATQAIERHRHQSRTLLDSLRALASMMSPIPGPKTLVLVSEGTLLDEDLTVELRRFADAAEQSRVSLYALHLQAPPTEASVGATSSDSRNLDDRLGFDGMANIAHAARGTAFRVIGLATPWLERIDTETAGYYLLTFERDPADRNRARVGIDVHVTREGLDVRARKEFTTAPPAAAPPAPGTKRPADLRTTMGELLKWPVPVTEIEIDAATYATPSATDTTGALVLVAAELTAGDAQIAALGYEIVDAAGKGVADTFDAPAELRPIGGGRCAYLVAVPLGPGSYRLKLGAVDQSGRRGSVEHAFHVPPWTGPVRASDLIVGDESDGGFRPIVRLSPGQARFAARVELRGAGLMPFAGVTATIAIGHADDASPEETVPVALTDTGDPLRRVVVARLDARAFAPGEYLLTIAVRTGGGDVIARSRRVSR